MNVIRLLFDECLGKPVVMGGLSAAVASTSSLRVELAHLQDFYEKGIADQIWVPAKAAEGWILISADRSGGSGRGRENVLPQLCRQFRMTHILLGHTIHQKKQLEKLAAILAVWHDIVERVSASQRGSRWVLRAGPAPQHRPYLEYRPYRK